MFEILSSKRIPDSLYTQEEAQAPTEIEIQHQLPTVIPSSFYLVEEIEETQEIQTTYEVPASAESSLYLSVEPSMVEGWIARTPCFKKYSQRSSVCDSCPIKTQCNTEKAEKSDARKEKRVKLKDLEERANKIGLTLKGLKIPKSVDLEAHSTQDCKFAIPCVVSGQIIALGEYFVHIKGFGAIKASMLNILKEYKDTK